MLKVLFVENLDTKLIEQIEMLYNSIKQKEENSTILRVYDKYYLTTEDGLNLYLIIEYEDTSINLWSYYKFGKSQTLQNSDFFYDFIKNQEKKKTTSQNWWKEYKDFCQSIKLRYVNYNTFEMCFDIFDDTVFDFASTFTEQNGQLMEQNQEQMIAEQPIQQDMKDFIIYKVNLVSFIFKNMPNLFKFHERYVFRELCIDNSIDNFQLQEYDEDYFILKAQQNQKNILIKAEKFQSLQDAEISILEYNRLNKIVSNIFVTNKIQKLVEVNGFTYTIIYEDEIDNNEYITLNQFLQLKMEDNFFLIQTKILNMFLNNLIILILCDINPMIMDLNTIYISKPDSKPDTTKYYPIKMIFQNPLFLITKLKQNDYNYFTKKAKTNIDEILAKLLIERKDVKNSIFNNFSKRVYDKFYDEINKLKRTYINKFYNRILEEGIKADYQLSTYTCMINQYIYQFLKIIQIENNSSNLFLTNKLQLSLSYSPIEIISEQQQQTINRVLKNMQIIKINLKQFKIKQIIEFSESIKSSINLIELSIKSNMTNSDDDYEIKRNILKKVDRLESIVIRYDNQHESYLNISVLKEKNVLNCIKIIFNNSHDFQSEEEQTNYNDDSQIPNNINQATQYFQIIEKLKEIKTLKNISIVLDYKMFFSSQEDSKNQISDLKEYKLNQQNQIEIKKQKVEKQKQQINEQTQLYLQKQQETLFNKQQHQGQTQYKTNNQNVMQQENLNPKLNQLTKNQKQWQKLQNELSSIIFLDNNQFYINQTKYQQNNNQDYNNYCVSLFQDIMPNQNIDILINPKFDLFNQDKMFNQKQQIEEIPQRLSIFNDKTNQLFTSEQKLYNNSAPNQMISYDNAFMNQINEFQFQNNYNNQQMQETNILPFNMQTQDLNLQKLNKMQLINPSKVHINEIQANNQFKKQKNNLEQEINQLDIEEYQFEHQKDEFEEEFQIELEEDYLNSINSYFFQFDNNMNNIIAQNIQQKLITDIQQILNANNQIIIRGIKNDNSQLILQFQHTQMHNIGSLKLYFTINEDTLKIIKFECRSIDKLLCLKHGKEISFEDKLIQLWIKAELQTDLIYDLIGPNYIPQCFHCDYNLVQSYIYKYQQNLEKLRIGIMLCQHSVLKNIISLNFIDYKQSKFYKLIHLTLIFKSKILNYKLSMKVLKKELKQIPNLLNLTLVNKIQDSQVNNKQLFQSLKKLNRLVFFSYC